MNQEQFNDMAGNLLLECAIAMVIIIVVLHMIAWVLDKWRGRQS